MSGGSSSGGKKKRARIEIIPLIDVIFFLLATFVLFTLSLTKSNGQPVKQPDSETGEARDPSGSHTVTILPEGALAWDKDPVSATEFLQRIQDYHQSEPDGRILINGDETAHFAGVIYVMDQARLAGFRKVFIETRTKQKTHHEE
ncbi:MAG TPA: biopolymer transporter ExbD [Opitutaceae bacterium]|jgi:biopolymer transport protein ExbD|nr:biopolymer transporter ExbD [Opitutaceae bacterium]